MNITADFKAFWAVYLRGLIIQRQRLGKTIITLFLTPVLYAVTFGWGIGGQLEMEGLPYLTFMLPGLIALSGMNQSFSIAPEINISRFLSHFFEEYLLSPAKDYVIVLGNVFYGVTKGFASFLAVIIIGAFFGIIPPGGFRLILPVFLNTFMFASLGVWIALSVKNHRDMSSFTSFVITPMSFIAGTFFSLENLSGVFYIISEIIPLTHSSRLIRSVFLGKPVDTYHYFVLVFYSALFFFMAVRRVRRAVS